jgi:hypothetical protein
MRAGGGVTLSKRLIMVLVGTLAISVVMAGCGDGGEKTSTVQIPKALFIKRADAICARIYARVESGYKAFVGKVGSEPFSDIDEIREFADTVLIPAKQKEVEDLRALGTPRGGGDRVEAILDAYEEGIGKAEESPRNAVTTTAGAFSKATDLTKEYGLKNCRY